LCDDASLYNMNRYCQGVTLFFHAINRPPDGVGVLPHPEGGPGRGDPPTWDHKELNLAPQIKSLLHRQNALVPL